jgi:uncharacterized protein YoxC
MPNFDNQTIQLLIIAVVALAVVLQAIVLLAIYLSIKKAARSLHDELEEVRTSVMPLVNISRDFFVRIAPNVEAATADVAELVHGLQTRTAALESSAAEILERLQRQTARLDTMLTGVLDTIERIGGFVAEAVTKPMRQLSVLLASAKAIIESLRDSAPEPRRPQASAGKDASA